MWELEHWSVQGGIEPLRTKSRQAYNLLINLNLIYFDLPNVGSLLIYLIKIIDKSTIFLIGCWLIEEKGRFRLQG